jgi:hypothetical protein
VASTAAYPIDPTFLGNQATKSPYTKTQQEKTTMASLEMEGPYNLDKNTIDTEVTKISPGNYALGEKNDKGVLIVSYVGRSDSDVNERLKHWVDASQYPMFGFSYADSAQKAFEKECQYYHEFGPESLDNINHPARPDGTKWPCPVCD